MKNIFKNKKGFSLIELMVAFAILSVPLLGTVAVTYSVLNNNTFNKKMVDAVNLAEGKIEDLRKNGYSSLTDGTYSDTSNSFTRQWTISNSRTSYAKDVSVTVSWTDQSLTRSISLTTTIAQ